MFISIELSIKICIVKNDNYCFEYHHMHAGRQTIPDNSTRTKAEFLDDVLLEHVQSKNNNIFNITAHPESGEAHGNNKMYQLVKEF